MGIYKNFLPLLPNELKFKIFSYLDTKDLLRAEQVSKDWQKIFNDDFLWREICIKEQICTRVEEKSNVNNVKSKRRINFETTSFWKLCYIRQCQLEKIWKIRESRNYFKVINFITDVSWSDFCQMVSSIQINQKYIVTASCDALISIFSITTGKNFKKLSGHTSGVILLKLLDSIIISGDGDGIIKIWQIDTGECTFNLIGHTSRVSCLSVYENKFVSGSSDFSLRFWNFETGTCLKILNGHTAAVTCVEYNGDLIISGSSDRTVKIWNINTGECLKTLEGHGCDVVSLNFDGYNIVSASRDLEDLEDLKICIWNVETGALKNNLLGCKDCLAFTERTNFKFFKHMFAFTVVHPPTPSFSTLDFISYDIKICDFATGEHLQTLTAYTGGYSIQCIQFVLNFALTSTYGTMVKLWDIKTGKFIRNLVNLHLYEDEYYIRGFRANETKLVCLTRNKSNKIKLIIWDFDFEHGSENNIMRKTINNLKCDIV